MSNSDNDNNNENFDFGSLLCESRKSQKYTIEDVSRHLKIPGPIIEAIEANDTASLPPPTFTKGYLRAYARYLEISEEDVLEQYNRAVPQNQVARLKSRSNLPSEKNSQTPIIRSVTILLVIAGIAALVYGIYDYYQEKADVIVNELEARPPGFSGSSLDSPATEQVKIEQHARITDDDQLVLQPAEPVEAFPEEPAPPPADTLQVAAEPMAEAIREPETRPAVSTTPVRDEPAAVEATDTIEFYAEKGSWMEVRDATDRRLFYNMLPEGASKTLRGVAPFYISLGNAQTTKVVINGLEVDMTDFIRANNTARFRVSSEQQSVVFH